MWDEVVQAKSENKRELILDGEPISKQITASGGLDEGLFELKELNFLRISHTCLQSLHHGVSQMSEKLTSLVLNQNQLSELPDSVGDLAHLKLLDLSGNVLTTLNPAVCKLQDLITLNVCQNQLEVLPAVSGLHNLHELLITGNKITELPQGLSDLEHLATIQADHNEIEILPENIHEIRMLKTLNLADNRLTDLPLSIVLLEKMKLLDLRRNKFTDRRLLKLANVDQTQPKGVFKFLKPLYDKQASSGAGKGKSGANSKSTEQELSEIMESIRVLHCADSKASGVEVQITEAVAGVRPHIVCCIIRNINLAKTSTTFKQFIALQTRLHEGICEKRLAATIATHDLKLVKAPIVYNALDPSQTMVIPLGRQKPLSAAEFMKKLQKEADDTRKAKKRSTTSGIHKYLDLLKGKPLYPFLVDRDSNVISFPPITNCESTKISAETTDLLVEVTGNKTLMICKRVMEELIKELLLLSVGSTLTSEDDEEHQKGNHLVVEQVRVVSMDGHLKTVYPSRIDLTDVPCHVERV